jgi:hypothetical protein
LNRLSTWLPGLLLLALIPHASVGQYQEWEQDRGPDSEGLWRDTRYFLGYQVAAIGILYAMPESVTGWTDEQKHNYSLSVWWDNVTSPSCDSDDFFINYVTHPYWGAAYYMRAHERGYDRKAAFWYSVLLSTTYEFGVEALFEEPSIQDLVSRDHTRGGGGPRASNDKRQMGAGTYGSPWSAESQRAQNIG